MEPGSIHDELQYRIESDKAHFGGALPSRNALAWHAYLFGLLEWSIIDRQLFERLAALLPKAEEDRVTAYASRPGLPSEEAIIQELGARIAKDLAQGGS